MALNEASSTIKKLEESNKSISQLFDEICKEYERQIKNLQIDVENIRNNGDYWFRRCQRAENKLKENNIKFNPRVKMAKYIDHIPPPK